MIEGYINVEDYLDITDLNGNIPGVLMVVTNRSAGKTTGAYRMLLDNAQKGLGQFAILFRRQYELPNSAVQFDDTRDLFFTGQEYDDKPLISKMARKYVNLNSGETLGFAVSLGDADNLKKYSGMFSNVQWILLDEFQSEKGAYIKNELTLFQSIYKTIARGGGKTIRPVRVLMLSNNVSYLNPYYLYWGIPERIRDNTRKIRGNGWVLILEYSKKAEEEARKNAFNQAFIESNYSKYSVGEKSLINHYTFIMKIPQKCKYLFTIYFENRYYGVRLTDKGQYHVSRKPDSNSTLVMVFEHGDIQQNMYLLDRHSNIWKTILQAYYNNDILYQDVSCKNVIYQLLGIKLFS